MADQGGGVIVSYDEVKNLSPNKFLYDVRMREEIELTGLIPKAVNVPCKLLILS